MEKMRLCLVWVSGRTIIGEVDWGTYEVGKPLCIRNSVEVKSIHIPVQIKDALTGQIKEEIREMITPASLAPLGDRVFDTSVISDLVIDLSETDELSKLYTSFRVKASGLTLAGSTLEQMKLKLVR